MALLRGSENGSQAMYVARGPSRSQKGKTLPTNGLSRIPRRHTCDSAFIFYLLTYFLGAHSGLELSFQRQQTVLMTLFSSVLVLQYLVATLLFHVRGHSGPAHK